MISQFSLDHIGVQVIATDGSMRWTLRDISSTFRANERIGLLGRNGSGKTTLARLIGQLDHPTTGKLQVRPSHARALLVLQRPEDHFVRGMVGEQVNSYAPRPMSPDAIHDLLQRVGLPVKVGRWPPLRLSTGQQRLVAFACALASQVHFIVMDEPMAGLDAGGRQLVKQSLIQLNDAQELGWMIISHHPDDLLGLVDRILVLEEGALLYDGPFQCAPLDILEVCLSAGNSSLYYWLRTLDSQGVVLPEAVYRATRPDQITDLISGAEIP